MSGLFSSPVSPVVIIGVLLLAAALFGILLRKRSRSANRPFGRRSTSTLGRQSCSYCRRKVPAKELTFYAGPSKVVGVCRQCRPQAERQALMRL
ncbi:hypothetical protein ACP26L_03370 [Paenibacillus sp. S-38]|uniref:hypothetical protein n=1 Tax=Paenibacillus sp. S-38 TaxID=3416710 RepID=UPI003CEA8372